VSYYDVAYGVVAAGINDENDNLGLAGKKWTVPRFLKRSLQVSDSIGLTLLVVLVIQDGG
jgi:hypothetical protein